jgi:hypothetical protein
MVTEQKSTQKTPCHWSEESCSSAAPVTSKTPNDVVPSASIVDPEGRALEVKAENKTTIAG